MTIRVQLKKLPKAYPEEPQQTLFKEALAYCNIKKGISKPELLQQMKECIPKFYKERGYGKKDNPVHVEELRPVSRGEGAGGEGVPR
jgi:hypothetical protein